MDSLTHTTDSKVSTSTKPSKPAREASLTFGSAKRELPFVLETLVLSWLDLCDAASVFFVSHGLSTRIVRFLQGTKHIDLPAEALEFENSICDSSVFLPNLALHCRSLTHVCVADLDDLTRGKSSRVNRMEAKYRDKWLRAVINNNHATLRCFAAESLLWTADTRSLLLTSCPRLEELTCVVDTDEVRGAPAAADGHVTPKNLPNLRRLTLSDETHNPTLHSQRRIKTLLEHGLLFFVVATVFESGFLQSFRSWSIYRHSPSTLRSPSCSALLICGRFGQQRSFSTILRGGERSSNTRRRR